MTASLAPKRRPFDTSGVPLLRVFRALSRLLVLVAFSFSGLPATSDTLKIEGARVEVPEGFLDAFPDTDQRTRFRGLLDFPFCYHVEEASFRLFERPRANGQADTFLWMRVPGEGRHIDDPIVVDHFCRSVYADRESRRPELEPLTCKLRETSRGVVGIELRRVLEFPGFGPTTRYEFVLPRRDDLLLLSLELIGDRRTEADALWERVLATFENDRPLPAERTRFELLPYVRKALVVLAPAVVLGVAWALWRRRRPPKVVRRRPRPPEVPGRV
jgi:hypothetical protein